jgi:hypothetical protein
LYFTDPPSIKSEDRRSESRNLSSGTEEKRRASVSASARDRLSDQEFDDDFTDPAVEEILSDEEMPDYADTESDFDLTEYEEALTEQFGQPFSLDSFQIPSLKV